MAKKITSLDYGTGQEIDNEVDEIISKIRGQT
jgi:hypothetical protein